jgi:hypothetical protein
MTAASTAQMGIAPLLPVGVGTPVEGFEDAPQVAEY